MRRSLFFASFFAAVVASASLFAAGSSKIPRGFIQVPSASLSGDRFVVDLKYDTDDNFLGRNVYAAHGVHACYVHPIMAERLAKLAPALEERGLKLVLWDCWRPRAVQEEMWKIMPDPRYVADPKKGSNHNRGLAIDASLADAEGRALPMPTAFDDFTERAASSAQCGKAERALCANRDLQVNLMREAGLEALPTEWWHYQPSGVAVEKYPVK